MGKADNLSNQEAEIRWRSRLGWLFTEARNCIEKGYFVQWIPILSRYRNHHASSEMSDPIPYNYSTSSLNLGGDQVSINLYAAPFSLISLSKIKSTLQHHGISSASLLE
jgi:hypothetical protein